MPHLKVFPALTDDVNQGWVWIRCPGISQREIVRIGNPSKDRCVYCEAIAIEPLFLEEYNKPASLLRGTIPDEGEVVVMNAWYRSRLGDIPAGSESELEVIVVTDEPSAQLFAALHHPQVVVRMATYLGIGGVVLGVIATVLAIVPFLEQGLPK